MMMRVPPYCGRPSVTAEASLVAVEAGGLTWLCVVSTPPNSSVSTPSGTRSEGAAGAVVDVVEVGVVFPSQKWGMTIDRKPWPPDSRSDLEDSSLSDWKKTLP